MSMGTDHSRYFPLYPPKLTDTGAVAFRSGRAATTAAALGNGFPGASNCGNSQAYIPALGIRESRSFLHHGVRIAHATPGFRGVPDDRVAAGRARLGYSHHSHTLG